MQWYISLSKDTAPKWTFTLSNSASQHYNGFSRAHGLCQYDSGTNKCKFKFYSSYLFPLLSSHLLWYCPTHDIEQRWNRTPTDHYTEKKTRGLWKAASEKNNRKTIFQKRQQVYHLIRTCRIWPVSSTCILETPILFEHLPALCQSRNSSQPCCPLWLQSALGLQIIVKPMWMERQWGVAWGEIGTEVPGLGQQWGS